MSAFKYECVKEALTTIMTAIVTEGSDSGMTIDKAIVEIELKCANAIVVCEQSRESEVAESPPPLVSKCAPLTEEAYEQGKRDMLLDLETETKEFISIAGKARRCYVPKETKASIPSLEPEPEIKPVVRSIEPKENCICHRDGCVCVER